MEIQQWILGDCTTRGDQTVQQKFQKDCLICFSVNLIPFLYEVHISTLNSSFPPSSPLSRASPLSHPFSLRSSFTSSFHLIFGLPLLLPSCGFHILYLFVFQYNPHLFFLDQELKFRWQVEYPWCPATRINALLMIMIDLTSIINLFNTHRLILS